MVGARGVFPATAVTRNNAPGDERLRTSVSFFRPSRAAPPVAAPFRPHLSRSAPDGGWENGRIAALVPPAQRALTPKIARHGADEDKHGRNFTALLRRRGLTPAPVPPETDYTMLLERRGIGLAHDRLRRDEPLTERDIVVYLAHNRVTEQRAAEQTALLLRHSAGHPEIGRALRMISADEDDHLAYTHEEPAPRPPRAAHGRRPRRVRLRTPRRPASHGHPRHARTPRRPRRPQPPPTSTPDPSTRAPHSHSRRLNSRYSSTSRNAITRITAGYDHSQCSSGMWSKFMP